MTTATDTVRRDPRGKPRRRAAAAALRGSPGWRGELRRMMESLSWESIAGRRRTKGRLPDSHGPARKNVG